MNASHFEEGKVSYRILELSGSHSMSHCKGRDRASNSWPIFERGKENELSLSEGEGRTIEGREGERGM